MLDIRLAEPLRHRQLTIYPLLAPAAVELPYQLLADALFDGLRISEVGTGSVPSLLAINDGSIDVLILDGEQLIGARQNRMTNRSVILPAGSKTEIPVSCMEQGRWHSVSDFFSPSPQHSPSSVRRKAREVEADYARGGEAPATRVLAEAQGGVWDSIAETADTLGGSSETGALNDLFLAREEDLAGGLKHFPLQPRQVGLLAFAGMRAIGMDVVGGTNLYARLHERLLRGYVLDAMSAPETGRAPGVRTAQGFLDRVQRAERVRAPSIGKGEYSVLSRVVIGGELLEAERLVHLSAFPLSDRRRRASEPQIDEAPPLAPPSRRRRQA